MSAHVPAGRINGVHAPTGTVLGPKEVTRELVIVTDVDELGVSVGYARQDDVDADALARIAERGPCSVTEARILLEAQAPVRARLRALFGGVL